MSKLSKWIKKHCYKVTMIDRRPFGEITMRFLEPQNIIGRIYSWHCAKKNLRKIKAKKGGYIVVGTGGKELVDKLEAELQKKKV